MKKTKKIDKKIAITIGNQPDVLFKKLIEHMNEALWMGDAEERTVYANQKFCTMLGYKLEEIIGRKSYDFWDEESTKRVQWVNRFQRKKEISSSYEGSLIAKNGKKIPILLSGTPLPDGGTFGIMTDLTEMKKKEASEKVLTSALEYTTDIIILCNEDHAIELWNKGAEIIFTVLREEAIGKKIEKFFEKEKLEELFSQKSVIHNSEIKGIQKNGSETDLSITLTPIFTENKKTPSHFLCIARDISIQKKMEEEIYLKYQKIQEAYNSFGILRRQMDYIFEILDMAGNYNDRQTIADFIVSSVIMLTRVDGCVLRSYNKKRGTLDLISYFGLSEDWRGKANIPYKNSLIQKAFQLKAPLKIIDVAKEPRYQSIGLARKSSMSSLLLIPLEFHGELIGSLSLYAKPERKLEIFENQFIEKYAKLIELIMATAWKEQDEK